MKIRYLVWCSLMLLAGLGALGAWSGLGAPHRPAQAAAPPILPTPSASPTPCSGAAWTAQAPYPMAIGGHAVAAQGGRLFSFGGLVNNTGTTAAYMYTPGTNSWSPIAPLPAARYWFSAVGDGVYIYLLGGIDANYNTTATLWRYDPATNTYNTSLASYSIPTYNHASAYLNGKIYRIAGRAIGTDYHVEVYTIATNSWAPAANYPFASHTLMAAALGGYIYAGGGNSAPSKTYRYDPATDQWDDAAIADLPQGRSAAASDVYQGRWLLAGGDVNFSVSTSAIAWDPATNTWTALPDMLAARDYLGGATAGAAFYAVGGDSGPGQPTTDTQQYAAGTCAGPTPSPSATSTPPATSPTPQPTVTSICVTGRPDIPCTPTSIPATATATPTVTATATAPGATPTSSGPTSTPPSTAVAPSATAPPGTTPTAGAPTTTPAPPTGTAPAGSATPAAPTSTPVPPTNTATACAIPFSDVHPADYFYLPVQYLYCRGVISGYGDNTFRPYAQTTRAQQVKLVVLGFGRPIATPANGDNTFADVPPAHPFFAVIETAAAATIVSGYNCGSPGEPCDSRSRPYFRPYANVTRGQLAKIDVVAAGWALLNPAGATFSDVVPNTAFYPFVETAYCHGIISGYNCGSPGEPCDAQNRPYFRQYNDATRGQIAKIVYLSVTSPSGCGRAARMP